MSDNLDENRSKNGFLVTTETIAKGAIRVKAKMWIDGLDIDEGIPHIVDLYEKTLKEYRERGFKIDGDN